MAVVHIATRFRKDQEHQIKSFLNVNPHVKVAISKISVVVHLVTPVVNRGNSKYSLILPVTEFLGQQYKLMSF